MNPVAGLAVIRRGCTSAMSMRLSTGGWRQRCEVDDRVDAHRRNGKLGRTAHGDEVGEFYGRVVRARSVARGTAGCGLAVRTGCTHEGLRFAIVAAQTDVETL